MHVVVPVQPDQLVKLLFRPGVSVSVMDVPDAKLPVQVPVVQLIPAGVLATVPVPVPAKVTVNTTPAVVPLKLAETVAAAVIVTVQVGVVPEQAPPQLEKTKFVPALAVSVTAVPCAKLALQVPGQLMPPDELVILPAPAAGGVIVSLKLVGGGGGGGVVLELELPPQPASDKISADRTANPNENRLFMAQHSPYKVGVR